MFHMVKSVLRILLLTLVIIAGFLLFGVVWQLLDQYRANRKALQYAPVWQSGSAVLSDLASRDYIDVARKWAGGSTSELVVLPLPAEYGEELRNPYYVWCFAAEPVEEDDKGIRAFSISNWWEPVADPEATMFFPAEFHPSAESRLQVHRPVDQFYTVARKLCVAWRAGDTDSFEQARSAFEESDTFVGYTDPGPWHFSGRQLQLMADLLTADLDERFQGSPSVMGAEGDIHRGADGTDMRARSAALQEWEKEFIREDPRDSWQGKSADTEIKDLPVDFGGERFCRLYEKVMLVETLEERQDLSLEIGAAELSILEKDWLLFLLVDTDLDIHEIARMASGGWGFSLSLLVEGGFRRGFAHLGIEITSFRKQARPFENIPPYEFLSLELELEKSLTFPAGCVSTEPYLWLPRERQVAGTPSEVLPPLGAEIIADTGAREFCNFYRRAVSPIDAAERMALAREVHASSQGDLQKAFLKFTLLLPGMDIATAETIILAERKEDEARDLYYANGITPILTEARPHLMRKIFIILEKRR